MDVLIKKIIKHPHFNTVSGAMLILFYLYFLSNHIEAVRAGFISPAILIFIAMEATVIYLLVIRDNPVERTSNLFAWIAAFAGTFLPLLFIPSGNTINLPLGNILLSLGGIMAIVSYLSLNSSFGLSPALRKVKTSGLYRVVRHPMYLSYLIIYIGYLNVSFSIFNALVFTGLISLLTIRIFFEEKVLMQNDEYKSYTKKVRHRVLPYIF